MAKDSASGAIAVGATVKFVGTVVALSEPNSSNLQNVWVQGNTTVMKDNSGATVLSQAAACHLFHGSQLTVGS